jgi:integrase
MATRSSAAINPQKMTYPVTLPYWLLGGFAGLRRAELERLEWKDIHFDVAKYREFTNALAAGNKEAIAKAEKEWRASPLIEVPALKAQFDPSRWKT